MATPSTPVLYSTVTHLKWAIIERFRGGKHYVWCSEHFDGAAVGASNAWASRAPSSNPKDIYAELKRAIRNSDKHCSKVVEAQASLKTLAMNWHGAKVIDDADRDEIVVLVDTVPMVEWRPKLFIIPTATVSGRCKLVPAGKRASTGLEWIIEDLSAGEYDLIELPDA